MAKVTRLATVIRGVIQSNWETAILRFIVTYFENLINSY